MTRLFGTDGVRGKAGDYPLDHETVARLGAALVRAMRPSTKPLRFIIGRGTRESGDWIERAPARRVHSGRDAKFTATLERHVESIVADKSWQTPAGGLPPVDRTDVIPAYIAHTRLALPSPERLGHFRLALDTANGATTTLAPRLFRELG